MLLVDEPNFVWQAAAALLELALLALIVGGVAMTCARHRELERTQYERDDHIAHWRSRRERG